MLIAEAIVLVAAAYAAFGLLFATAFAVRGIATVDHAARGAHPLFRLMIVPGAAALWPLLMVQWVRAARTPARR